MVENSATVDWNLFYKVPDLLEIDCHASINSLTGISALAKFCPKLSTLQLGGCNISSIPPEFEALAVLPISFM